MVAACGTVPKPEGVVETPATTQQDKTQRAEGANTPVEMIPEVVVQEEEFDPNSISEEVFSATKADIQALITDLNRIVRARNYNAWVSYLDDSYFLQISSQEFLEEKTEELYKRDQIVAGNMGRDPAHVAKRILRNANDYFTHVVVPSRSQDTLDDIAFVSPTHVKAYTVDTRGQRLILYELETIEGKWKIVS
jgi:hypothetical protein